MAETLSKPRHRLLRFSLRGLLLLIVILAIPMTWLGWAHRKVRQHQIAVAALERAECRVYDCGAYQALRSPVVSKWFETLLGEEVPMNVTVVHCHDSRFSDAALANLDGMIHIRWLELDKSGLTDAGLVHFKGLQQLRCLSLDDTLVTDAGLARLQGLIHLTELSLERTRVTDAGLVNLAGLKELEMLNLNETPVTDAGLVHLQGLSKLEVLDLKGTHVTDAGVEKLKKTLPNLDVVR